AGRPACPQHLVRSAPVADDRACGRQAAAVVPACFFFFFQAEDGIRDFHVTGVQTCALPISRRSRPRSSSGAHRSSTRRSGAWTRSEERRVGKECRSRWAGNDEKKKIKIGYPGVKSTL